MTLENKIIAIMLGTTAVLMAPMLIWFASSYPKVDTKFKDSAVQKHYELENSYEYNIERAFEFKQNIEEDRVASYSSTNVIDTLTVRINLCNKLNAVFEPSSYDPYIKESSFDNGLCYTSRGILFPGEKFKVFIFRKNGI